MKNMNENNVRPPRLLVTTEEAAEMIGISTRKIAYLREERELQAVIIGRSVRFRIKDIEAFIMKKLE